MSSLSFHEKSTWGTFAALAVIGTLYFLSAWRMWHLDPVPTPAALFMAAGFTVLLVAVLVIYHVIIAVAGRADDGDERDRLIGWRAGSIGGLVLGFGVFSVIFVLIAGGVSERVDTSAFAVANLLALAVWVAELVEQGTRLYFYRRGV